MFRSGVLLAAALALYEAGPAQLQKAAAQDVVIGADGGAHEAMRGKLAVTEPTGEADDTRKWNDEENAASKDLAAAKSAENAQPDSKEPKAAAADDSKGVGGKKPKTTAEDKASLLFSAEIMFAVLLVMIVAVVVFESWVFRTEKGDVGEEPDATQQDQATSFRALFDGIYTLSAPYFNSPTGWKGRLFVMQLSFFVLLSMFQMWVENNWRQQFWDCFQSGTGGEFKRLMGYFLVLVSVGVLTGVYATYTRWLLYVEWRTHMTQSFVQKWLHAKAFCELARSGAIDNPDQRVQQDISMYTQLTVDLTNDLISQAAKLLLFIPLLYIYSPDKAFGLFYCPGWLFYLVLAYALVGTLGTHHFGKKLIPIAFARQRAEADFRHELVEVRDHADGVALAGGERHARARAAARFQAFRGTFWYFMQTTKRLSYFKHVFGFLNWLVPFCILAPSFFAGDITLGQLFQLIHVIDEVQGAMDWLIDSYEAVSKWRACADRLLAFDFEIEKCALSDNPGSGGRPGRGKSVVAKDLVLKIQGKLLWRCPSLEIPAGWVLFNGQAGSGKSSLLKVLAGTWPTEGSVCVAPNRVFIPEEPYVPNCSLREALLYPHGDRSVAEADLRAALRAAGLGHLEKAQDLSAPAFRAVDVKAMAKSFVKKGKSDVLKKLGTPQEARKLLDGDHADETAAMQKLQQLAALGREDEEEWMTTLSIGERQRLTVAQLLLRKPQPDAIFFDESFSHVSKEGVAELCTLLRKRLPDASVIQVSHDTATMRPLHDYHLEASVVDEQFVTSVRPTREVV